MANQDVPLGFNYIQGSDCGRVRKFEVTNGDSLAANDTVYCDSAGRAADTMDLPLGVAMSSIIDGYTGEINATGATASEDYIFVYTGVFNMYIAQITTGALADPYTTRSSAACFDETGNAGLQEINAAAHTKDLWKVVGPANEYDTGEKSAVGSNQKVYCQLNPLVHVFGSAA